MSWQRPLYLLLFLIVFLSPSSHAFSQQTSTITATATPTTATVGQSVSLNATVTGQTIAVPIPSGSVSFLDGSTNLGSATLSSVAVVAPKVVTFAQLFGSLDATSQGTTIWADLNGDGKSDLLSFGTTFQVFLNNGNGTFISLTSQAYALNRPALIDFDGDGKTDIISVGNGLVVQVLYGNGNGVFQAPVAAPGIVPPPAHPDGSIVAATVLAAGDIAGVGKPYILLGDETYSNNLGANAAYASVTVFKNNGNGNFVSLGSFPVTSTPDNFGAQDITQVVLADFNGDGKLDVAAGVINSSLSQQSFGSVLFNNGDGTLTAPTIVVPHSATCFHGCSISLAAGDFGNRGKTDLVALSNIPLSSGPINPSIIMLYPGNGDGTFANVVPTNAATNSSQVLTEDINGDGNLDLVDDSGYAYLGKGDFTFTATQNLLVLGGSTAQRNLQPLSADFDGDGVPDLLFNTPSPIVQLGSRSAIAALPAISTLAAGVHAITANYAGDAHFAASTSPAVTVTVGKFTTTIVGGSTPNPALSTQSITIAAQVNSSGPIPTGTVTFTQGSTALGSATLNSKGAGSISFTFGTADTQNITVTYSGDASNQPTTRTITTVTVANFPSTIIVTASPNPTIAGQNVTFSTVVRPNGTSPTPTGNVVFLNGSTQIGSVALDASGKASLTTSFASVGNQTITANYVGDAANQPSSTSVIEAVLAAFNFQPTGGSTALSVQANSSVVAPLTVTSLNGFAGSVSFSCTGLPAGATCSFSPASVTVVASAQAVSTLTVATAATVGSNQMETRGRSMILVASVLFGSIFLLPVAKKNRFGIASLLIIIILASTFGIVGCGGSSPTPTAPSTYNFNVVAASGNVQQTSAFTLTVR